MCYCYRKLEIFDFAREAEGEKGRSHELANQITGNRVREANFVREAVISTASLTDLMASLAKSASLTPPLSYLQSHLSRLISRPLSLSDRVTNSCDLSKPIRDQRSITNNQSWPLSPMASLAPPIPPLLLDFTASRHEINNQQEGNSNLDCVPPARNLHSGGGGRGGGGGLQPTSPGGRGGSSTNFTWGEGGVFNQLHLGGGGGSSTNFTWGEGGGLGGTHHALQLDVINVLTCGQKEEMKVCTCLYSCVALHHGILPPPPPCEQKDRNSENITFAILRMRAVIINRQITRISQRGRDYWLLIS